MRFTKMTGAGNDFIIIDARENFFPTLDRVSFAIKVCHRHFGIGADGLFFIEAPANKENDFKWDFYNADGSVAEMCGNGSRCVARYAFDNKIAGREMKFETIAGIVSASLSGQNDDSTVEVQMTKPKMMFKSLDVPVGEHIKVQVGYWDTGVPHVVKQTDDWSNEYLNEMGEYLRNHDFFKKTNGANATFFEIIDKSKVQAATYERGVEGVTLACGTGAVAAAAQAVVMGEASPIEVMMPGGLLCVTFGDNFSWAKLKGPAEYVCSGELHPEILKVRV